MSYEAEYQRGLEQVTTRPVKLPPVHFYPVMREIPSKTEALKKKAIEEGKDPDEVQPVFEEFDYAEIPQMGCTDKVNCAVTADIKARYPREWEAYKAGQQYQDGTALTEWKRLPNEIVLRLQLINIHTIEQFMDAPEAAIKGIAPNMATFQAEARQFIGKQAFRAQSEKEAAKDAMIADLQEKVNQLLAASQAGKEKQKLAKGKSNDTAYQQP